MTNDMATLWTAVAAAGGAVLGAALSGGVAYEVTKRQVSSANDLAEKRHVHERELASEALSQRRLEEAYVVVAEWALPVDDTLVELSNGQTPKDREDIQMRARAVASLIASTDVAQLVDDYSKAVRHVGVAVGGLPGEVQERIIAARKSAEKLLEAMRTEMGSKGRLPSEFPA